MMITKVTIIINYLVMTFPALAPFLLATLQLTPQDGDLNSAAEIQKEYLEAMRSNTV